MFWDFPGACITPKKCKINFAVPSDTTLKIESPKYDNIEIRTGILHSCLDSFSLASPTPISTWKRLSSLNGGPWQHHSYFYYCKALLWTLQCLTMYIENSIDIWGYTCFFWVWWWFMLSNEISDFCQTFYLRQKNLYNVGDSSEEDFSDRKDPQHWENAGKGSTQKRRLSPTL